MYLKISSINGTILAANLSALVANTSNFPRIAYKFAGNNIEIYVLGPYSKGLLVENIMGSFAWSNVDTGSTVLPNGATELTLEGTKSRIASLPMPANGFINITPGASGSTYTVPKSGWMFLAVNGANSTTTVGFSSVNGFTPGNGVLGDGTAKVYIPVFKGQTVLYTYIGAFQDVILRFIPAQGEV
jgi:hypothetical protein